MINAVEASSAPARYRLRIDQGAPGVHARRYEVGVRAVACLRSRPRERALSRSKSGSLGLRYEQRRLARRAGQIPLARRTTFFGAVSRTPDIPTWRLRPKPCWQSPAWRRWRRWWRWWRCRAFSHKNMTSALPQKADISCGGPDFRLGPIATVCTAKKDALKGVAKRRHPAGGGQKDGRKLHRESISALRARAQRGFSRDRARDVRQVMGPVGEWRIAKLSVPMGDRN